MMRKMRFPNQCGPVATDDLPMPASKGACSPLGLMLLAAPLMAGCGRSLEPVAFGAERGCVEPGSAVAVPPRKPAAASPPRTQLAHVSARIKASTVRGSRLRVLGTAQDGGFPHAACGTDRCRHARKHPEVARYISSLGLIVPNTGRYLVDATPDIRDQLELMPQPADAEKMNRAPVDGVFLTHAHIGHYLGLAFFGFEAIHTRGLPAYATPAMGAFLRDHAPWQQLMRLGNLEHRPLDDGDSVALGDVRVTAIRVPHRNEYADTVAYRFQGPNRTAVFVPDCDPWHRWRDGAEALLEGVDVALVDATFYSGDELPGRDLDKIGHPLMVDTMDWLEPRVKSGAMQVVFIHLNHSNPAIVEGSPEHTKVKARGFAVARDGDEIGL